MRYRDRDQSYRFVEASNDFVVSVSRGGNRSFELSRPQLIFGGVLASLLGLTTIGAAGYLMFRDDMLSGLLDRQTQMQYAYEDKIAAMKLRLDQVTSRQFVNQDGVEGKVQNLVLRQARLETRAAAVAQLFERTARGASVSVVAPSAHTDVAHTVAAHTVAANGESAYAEAQRPATARSPLQSIAKATASAPAPAARAPRGAVEEVLNEAGGKPEPEMDLRLGAPEGKPLPLAPPSAAPKQGELTPIDTSFRSNAAAAGPLAYAADPDLPMPTRLESLAASLDKIERDQSRRLSGIVRPALEAAGKLRRAFDIAGLPVDKYVGRKGHKPAVGGPFVAAKAADSLFERDLAAAQNAVATLDGLRSALPSTPLRKPLAGALQITSTFGYRTDPFFGRPALHSGVDLREEYGTPVKATAGGVVTVAGPNGGYGNMVEIDHGGGLATRYAHLSSISVNPGDQAPPGAVVGRIGSTGRSTGPHLHYEVRMDGEAVDPSRFLKAAIALSE